MAYIFVGLFSMVCGAFAVFVLLEKKRMDITQERAQLASEKVRLQDEMNSLRSRRDDVLNHEAHLETMRVASERSIAEAQSKLNREIQEFQKRWVTYQDLQNENSILKRDLRNIDLALRKVEIDKSQQHESRASIDERSQQLAARYLKDNVKWISGSLNPNNFANCKQRLADVIERCRDVGYAISEQLEAELVAELRAEFERVVRAAFEREEQARIKSQIKEEQMREREIERELKQLDRERDAIQAALEVALARAKNEHSAEVENLKARLAEAEEKSRRATSQAQLTKSGHIYVISNIGSFGDQVFKIGMTRRLEPAHRVRELGDASVPFPFDVHMMIAADDAPTLENILHRSLHRMRVNKANPRKEFFKTDLDTIVQIVKEHRGEVQYVADAEALEYRQSLTMTDDDQEYIESVYDKYEEEDVGDR